MQIQAPRFRPAGHQRIDAGAERPAGHACQQQPREQDRRIPGTPGIDNAGCDRDADETAHAVAGKYQGDGIRTSACQFRQQRPHESEHHELTGHLQRRDREQQNDHAVAAEIGPCLEIDRRPHQAARQTPQQQQETHAA